MVMDPSGLIKNLISSRASSKVNINQSDFGIFFWGVGFDQSPIFFDPKWVTLGKKWPIFLMVTIGLAKGSYFFLDLAVVSIDVALLMVEFFGEAAKLPQLWLVDASCGGLPSTHG